MYSQRRKKYSETKRRSRLTVVAYLTKKARSCRILSRPLYNCRESSTNRPLFMQNEPNFSWPRTNATSLKTKGYANEGPSSLQKNEPNRTQFQTPHRFIKSIAAKRRHVPAKAGVPACRDCPFYQDKTRKRELLFMHIKANLPNAQRNVTSVFTKDYENAQLCGPPKGKANANPTKPKTGTSG